MALGIGIPLLLIVLLFYGLGGTHYTLIIASILAYLTNPAVERFIQRGFNPSWVCLGFTFFVMFVIAVFLFVEVPIALSQVMSLLAALPKSIVTLSTNLRDLLISKGMNPEFIRTSITDNLSQIVLKVQDIIVASSQQLLTITIIQVQNVVTLIINLLLFPMLYYSLLRHHEKIGKTFMDWIPKEAIPFWMMIYKAGSQVLNGYLRGQGMIMLVLGISYTIGLQMLGIPFATLIGVLTGVLTIIPYVGFSIGLCLSLIMGATLSPALPKIISVIGLFTVVGILENVFLIPQLIGHHLGIHPVVALLAIMIGGNNFGIPGFVLAVPLTSLLVQLLAETKPYVSQLLHLSRRPRKTSPSHDV
tara:strand:- start:2211 stop:3290 length:1080 start_codon:yes stop_codon:yes gene_type:complete